MFDKEDSYNPGGDFYQEPEEKNFQDVAGEMMGGVAGAAGAAGKYAGIAGNYAGSAAGTGKEAMKKMIPLAIGGVILLIIIIGIIWWFGQQQTLSININGLDAGSLSSARLTVSGGDGKPIYNKTGSNHQVPLSPGTYTIKVSATGYKTKTINLTTPYEEDGSRKDDFTYNLEKNISATIGVKFDYTSIYSGQELEGMITITNNGTDAIDQGEVGVKDASNIEVIPDAILSKFSVSGNGGIVSIPFKVKVKGTITKITPAKASLYIKGTTIKEDINMQTIPTVPIEDIALTAVSEPYKNESLEAGKRTIMPTIKIKNKNKTIPLENIIITITPNTEPQYAERLNWFEFGSYNVTKNSYLIDKIEPNTEVTVVLYVEPELSAEINDDFMGVFSITSLSMRADINKNMLFKVKTKKTAVLNFTPATGVKIECDQVLGTCKAATNTQIGTLKNDGTETINNITVEMDTATNLSNEECSWLSIQTSNIQSLSKADGAYKLLANISPGITDKPSILCYIKWKYINPITYVQDAQRSATGILIAISTK